MSTNDSKEKLASLLPQLMASGVDALLPYLAEFTAQQGHVFIKQGDKDEDMYFVLSGTLSVFEKISINRQPVVLHTATFPGPVILGEVAIMTDAERTATVVAMSEADCYKLTRKKFDELIQGNAKIAMRLLQAFGGVMYRRQTSFQNKVRGNILRECRSAEGGIAKLTRYTGKVSRTSASLADKLFSDDFEGVNYDSHS